jgi:hypothetical protein
MIRYVKHTEIDKRKWDVCIANADNQLLYAYSWYLDIVSPLWDALVYDDYRYIMPLPVKKYLGFKYLVQPSFCQQLGVFSVEPVTHNILDDFLNAIKYKYINICINNTIYIPKGNMLLAENPNFVLSLYEKYEELENRFSENTRRNIKKAQSQEILIRTISYETYLDFFQQHRKGVSDSMFTLFAKVIDACSKKNACEILGAYSAENNLLAVSAFPFTGGRYVNLAPASSPEGTKKSAMFLLVSTFIQNHTHRAAVLDFEGSKIEGVARFYKGFGAENQAYFHIQKTTIPFFFLLKKVFKH